MAVENIKIFKIRAVSTFESLGSELLMRGFGGLEKAGNRLKVRLTKWVLGMKMAKIGRK
tara:strand:+ start:497 stop:673 length:177 start_codon:yes stop_codon:yes gene_type:complete